MPDIINLLPDAIANQIAAGRSSTKARFRSKGVAGKQRGCWCYQHPVDYQRRRQGG